MIEPTADSLVSLQEVDEENLVAVLKLSVKEAQKNFVAANAVSIAEAYFARERAWFRAIYAGDTPVGFLMLEDKPDEPQYFLWRLMIDSRYQGLGFGQKAVELLAEHVKTRPNAKELLTSFVPADGGPGPFYHKLGFVETGDIIDDEVVAKLDLK